MGTGQAGEGAGHTLHQISSSAWGLPLVQAREIAYAALRLYEGIEAESWSASHRLEMRLQAFQQRIMDAQGAPQPAPADEPVVFGGGPA